MIIKNQISPSMMCADALRLADTLSAFEKCKIEYLHIDIMDGDFVPNFTLGTDYCRMLKKNSTIPLDIHLMVRNPENKLAWFDFGEGDYVSVHAEATDNLADALREIKSRGARAMAAINPETPVSAITGVLDLVDGVLVMTVNPGFAGQKMIPATLDKIRELRACLVLTRADIAPSRSRSTATSALKMPFLCVTPALISLLAERRAFFAKKEHLRIISSG